jgi:nitroreductase
MTSDIRTHYSPGMETWDALRARRNVRSYTDEPIADADLDRILEAGRRSPSASNRQKWDFVVVTDPQQLTELGTVWQGARHVPGSAATIVLVLPKPESDKYLAMDQYDLGQATMAMMLAATDLGIGTGHSAVGEQEAARQILGLPDDYYAAYMLALGHPADRPLTIIKSPGRRPFDEVVHRGQW